MPRFLLLCCAVPCACRWLDKGEDDGATERELYPGARLGKDSVNWRLEITTGD